MTETIPVRRSSLIGRQADIEGISSQLETTSLITLVGPGGVGKTSLAHEVARLHQHQDHEVHLVDLSTASSDATIDRAVADQLGLPASNDLSAVDALAVRLGNGSPLLVLDNCEQVLDGVADLVDELLVRCPTLSVLATSRERLDVEGELVWPVRPLSTRSDTGTAPAVQLLLERIEASAAHPLGADERTSLADLAQQLDGVPLALELAAARLATLPFDELRGQLGDHLPDLRGGRRSADRHRSLGDVVRWSYDLLDPTARRVLDMLSIFVGGFTRQAAQELIPGSIDQALNQLVEASLLTIEEGPLGRYRMLEMIRAFARRQLDGYPDRDDLAKRHAEWIASFVTTQKRRARSAEEADATIRFDAELPNVGAALLWACRSDEDALRSDIILGLEDLLFHRAGREIHAWVEEAAASISDPEQTPGAENVTILASLAALRRGDLARSMEYLDVAKAAGWRGDDLALGVTAIDGILAMFRGDFEQSQVLLDRNVAETTHREPWVRAMALFERSLPLSYSGRSTEGLAAARAAADVADATGSPTLLSWVRYAEAEALMALDPPEALRTYADSYRYSEAVQNPFLLALVSLSRASALARYGTPAEAFEHFERSITLFSQTSSWSFLSTSLRNLTELLARVERYADATVIRAAIEELEGTTAVAGQDAARDQYLKALLEDRLLSAPYKSLVEEGRRLTRDEVLDRARRVVSEEIRGRRGGAEFAAVVFTDLVNATAFMAQSGDRNARDVMRRYETLTQELMNRHRGKRVKGTGDGVLATFPTVSDALRCVSELLDILDESIASGELPLTVRVGVHAGEMIDETDTEDGDDVYGTVVNLTARVVDRADGGEVVVTDTVRQIVVGSPFAFESMGEFNLKGISEPICLHRLLRDASK